MLHKQIIDSKQFDLKSILSFIHNDIANYNWVIYEFDGILSSGSKFDINKISSAAIQNKFGYPISSNHLFELATDIKQTYDLILAGKRGCIKEFENTDAWREGNNLVIEMVDCSNWELYSGDSQLISKLKHHLQAR